MLRRAPVDEETGVVDAVDVEGGGERVMGLIGWFCCCCLLSVAAFTLRLFAATLWLEVETSSLLFDFDGLRKALLATYES